jgi:hypothetical protein
MSMPTLSHQPVLGSHRIEPRADVSAIQALHVPTPMLRDMEKHAEKLGRDVSYCARMAWSIACSEVGNPETAELAKQSRLMTGRKRPVNIELPMSTWLHLTIEAERLDRSRSWLLQRSWLVARSRILSALR